MKKLLLWLVLLVAAFAGYCQVTGYRPAFLLPYWPAPVAAEKPVTRRSGPTGPIAVLAEVVKYADVPVNVDAIGTAQALNTVVVRSQIDGKLIEIDFREGQDVKAGDILAKIDPATYQAQYDQAVAKLAQDQAQLANARLDLERYSKLAASQYTSRQQADTQAAAVAQYEATTRSDQASIDNTKAILAYTTIRAPMDGRTGLRAVDNGNILHASDANGVVTLTQLRPIAAVFNLPQQHVRAAMSAFSQGPLRVDVLDADNATLLDTGKVTVIDNQVDQTNGTVKFKGEFPNTNLQLWPGQFVNVRVAVSVLKHVMVVPAVAIQRGSASPYLFKINDDMSVTQVNVTVSRQDELTAVISGELVEGQKIVVSGFARLKDGAKIKLPDGTGPAIDAAKPAASASDAAKPDSPKPDAAKPEAAKPADGTDPAARKHRKKDAAGTENKPAAGTETKPAP